MNKNQAEIISELLNDRGFVIDEDIDDIPVSYTGIASWITKNENLLREKGYEGGPLRGWSSGFRGFGCAYGVTDSEKNISNEWIDNYCVITEAIEDTNVSIKNVIKYKLSVSFECSCGHTNYILPGDIPILHKDKNLTNLEGRCTKYPSSPAPPTGLNKPWKRT